MFLKVTIRFKNALLLIYKITRNIILATDLDNPCTTNEECQLGSGGANSVCDTGGSNICICDSGYVKESNTCNKGKYPFF